ncbi:MAG: hypothetical protein AAB426_09800 [Myxococcota bacterium]
MLLRRPPDGRLREQLFWLVDIVFACKSSEDVDLAGQASLVEEALGNLGDYLETGDTDALEVATKRVEQFARLIRSKVTMLLAEG